MRGDGRVAPSPDAVSTIHGSTCDRPLQRSRQVAEEQTPDDARHGDGNQGVVEEVAEIVIKTEGFIFITTGEEQRPSFVGVDLLEVVELGTEDNRTEQVFLLEVEVVSHGCVSLS